MTKMTIYRMVPSGSYMVLYKFNGEDAKFISLDRSNAEAYAAKHHGSCHTEFIEKAFEVEVPNGQASDLCSSEG